MIDHPGKVLLRAAEMLELGEWCQGTLFRDEEGRNAYLWHGAYRARVNPDIRAACAVGYMYLAAIDGAEELSWEEAKEVEKAAEAARCHSNLSVLRRFPARFQSMAAYNDGGYTTKRGVVELLRDAAQTYARNVIAQEDGQ